MIILYGITFYIHSFFFFPVTVLCFSHQIALFFSSRSYLCTFHQENPNEYSYIIKDIMDISPMVQIE